ncbi:MAG: hypothetical protein WAK16_10990 [Candidatus Cybelea sp.]
MADLLPETVKDSAFAWALDRALYLAVATGVFALLLSTLVPDTDAERYATVAYLAVIFSAIVLAIRVILTLRLAALAQDCASRSPRMLSIPSFPATLGLAAGMIILLTAATAFTSNPGAEVQLIVLCLVAVGVAAMGRAGAFARWRSGLRQGGPLATATRYAGVVTLVALALAALLPIEVADLFAKLGYAAACVATVGFLALVLAPRPGGIWIRRAYAAGLETSGSAIFQPVIRYAAIALVAAFFIASLLPRWLAEPFAVIGYVAAAVATICLGAECRRMIHKRSVAAP